MLVGLAANSRDRAVASAALRLVCAAIERHELETRETLALGGERTRG